MLASKVIGSLWLTMDSRNGSGSIEDSRTEASTVDESNHLDSIKIVESSSTSSPSSSADTSADDLFQVDPNKMQIPTGSAKVPIEVDEEAKPPMSSEIDIFNNKSSILEECDNGSPCPASSSRSDLTHESSIMSISPTQSPPIQVMDRHGGFDPTRIPSSVFERSTPATPMEWSAASNESLFSIHVGNHSFSRDHVFKLGKSGELTKTGEFIVYGPTPPPSLNSSDRKSADIVKDVGDNDDENETVNCGVNGDETLKDDPTEEKMPPPQVSCNSSPKGSHRSDGSETSSRSFEFLVRKKKCACSRCYWSNCSCAFCYCTWARCLCKCPSCLCKWPRCYCSSCRPAVCHSWNCSRKCFCCLSSPVLTERGSSGSLKVEPKKHHRPNMHLQAQDTGVTSNCVCRKWFKCLFCCPPCRRCHCLCCCC